MWQNAQDTYFESRILSASPIGLIRLLYQGAAGAVRDARRHLAAGEIRERARAISKACDILAELSQSLDHARGADLSRRLAELYFYMMGRLAEANLKQSDGALAEVQGLLATLAEAWEAIETPETAAASALPWAEAPAQELACASEGWSL